MTVLAEANVLSNVGRYLEAYGSSWEAHITGARFYWNEGLPLYEIAIRSSDGRQGYLLVSDSQELPFLISRGLNGQLLSSLLRQRMADMARLGALKSDVHEDSFQYIVPFGFIAHLSDGMAVQLDDGVVVEMLKGSVDQAPPSGEEVLQEIAREWAYIDQGFKDRALINEEQVDSGPYYNQAYNASCVISGCTAVAWATWAAWLKGNAALLPSLFSTSSCWYDDWGTFWACRQPTDECKDVDQLIWWFNHKLGTVNGGTPANNVGHGSAVFGAYGSPGIVARQVAPDAGTVGRLVRERQSVLFCGVREWQFLCPAPGDLGMLYDDPAGHCVVIHGVRGANEILVNMGWGRYVRSLWWNINSISQRQAFSLFKG